MASIELRNSALKSDSLRTLFYTYNYFYWFDDKNKYAPPSILRLPFISTNSSIILIPPPDDNNKLFGLIIE